MGTGCAAAPTFSSDRASGTISVVRAHAFASLSLLLDQHEEDADALDALHSLDALDSLDSLDEEQC